MPPPPPPPLSLRLIPLLFLLVGVLNPSFVLVRGSENAFSILNQPDYEHHPPPPPPPPPPSGPPADCESGLGGVGSFDSVCELRSSVALSGDLYVKGSGSLVVLSGVVLGCAVPGCSIAVELGGDLRLMNNSALVAGSVWVVASNMSVLEGAALNTTALGGAPPERTTGAGSGTHGDGGGHGGRGASCYVDDGQKQEDSWGGDVYSWDSLMRPVSYGSKGGTTSLEEDYGGGGGGRVFMEFKGVLMVDGLISADGGDGGPLGGGGSGGSICISANRM